MDIVKNIADYGLALGGLITIVIFLVRYIQGVDKKKDQRIEKLETEVLRLNEEIVQIKEQQAQKFMELTLKMVDVIEKNTDELGKSRKVQENLQRYLEHFISSKLS